MTNTVKAHYSDLFLIEILILFTSGVVGSSTKSFTTMISETSVMSSTSLDDTETYSELDKDSTQFFHYTEARIRKNYSSKITMTRAG